MKKPVWDDTSAETAPGEVRDTPEMAGIRLQLRFKGFSPAAVDHIAKHPHARRFLTLDDLQVQQLNSNKPKHLPWGVWLGVFEDFMAWNQKL